jgi:hypothetical protein
MSLLPSDRKDVDAHDKRGHDPEKWKPGFGKDHAQTER